MTNSNTLADQLGKEMPEGKKLFTIVNIENTPFKILKSEEGNTLVFGKYRLTEPLEEENQVHQYLETEKWNIIATIALIIMDKIQNGKQQPETI